MWRRVKASMLREGTSGCASACTCCHQIAAARGEPRENRIVIDKQEVSKSISGEAQIDEPPLKSSAYDRRRLNLEACHRCDATSPALRTLAARARGCACVHLPLAYHT